MESAGNEPVEIAMRAFYNFMNQGNYSRNKHTVLDDKLTELYESAGDGTELYQAGR